MVAVWNARQTGNQMEIGAPLATLEVLKRAGILHSWTGANGGTYWMVTSDGVRRTGLSYDDDETSA